MNDKASHARQWLAKADSDLTAARRLLEAGGPYDAVCFHAQQAAEKGLKAVLAGADVPIPQTHNLEDLQAHCVACAATTPADDLATMDLSDLTPFAVESRYDIEFWPERAEAEDAVAKAARVCAAATQIVGMHRG
jgi:HEPN domain-containing protein